MAATITESLKRDILTDLYNSTQNVGLDSGQDSDRFYLAIGRSEEWDSDVEPPAPTPSNRSVKDFQASIQSMKLVPDVSYVVPRHSWTAGNFYEAWDDKYNSNTTISASGDIQNPYYVLTDDDNVYVCLQKGYTSRAIPRASLYKPIDTSGNPFSAGDDGYIWKFMYNIGAAESRKYITSAYMPVEKVLDSSQTNIPFDNLSVSRRQQFGLQNNAIPGQIIGIAIDSGGSGFTSKPTITITSISRNTLTKFDSAQLDSAVTPAQAFARIHNGSIYEVIMKADSTDGDSVGTFTFGKNYFDASITVSGGGGTGAKLRAIIANDSGMGANPIKDLNSSAIMFNTTLDGTENNDFQVTNDFRQIGIIKNPLKDSAQYPGFSGDSAASDVTLNALKKLYVAGGLNYSNILGDETVIGSVSNARAVLDYFDEANDILYVHQTRETGFTPFTDSDTVSVGAGGSGISVTPNPAGGQPVLRPAEVNNFSGEVIYIDNRSPVTRDNEQTEDIKIVIDL